MNILIVDDSRVSRVILRTFSEALNYNVVAEASDGKQAISMYKKFKPEIIVSDLEMPEMDGIEMTKIIRTHNSSVKIIILISIVNKKVIQKAILNGATAVITKPITQEKLEQAIQGGA